MSHTVFWMTHPPLGSDFLYKIGSTNSESETSIAMAYFPISHFRFLISDFSQFNKLEKMRWRSEVIYLKLLLVNKTIYFVSLPQVVCR